MVRYRPILSRLAGLGTLILSLIAVARFTEVIIEGRTSTLSAQAAVEARLPHVFTSIREKQLPWTFAATLHDEYQQNESEANHKYRWKYYSLVCEVELSSQTEGGEPFVTCKTRDEDNPVYLHFDRAWAGELQKLAARDLIVAVGRPNGLTLGSAHVECVQFRRPALGEAIR